MKVYIATGLENWEAHNQLREALHDRGHSITYDWTVHGPAWGKGLAALANVAMLELRGVREADVVIVIMPGGRGTHFEMGCAAAFGKPVFLIADCRKESGVEWWNKLTLAIKETCAFYHLPNSRPLVLTSRFSEADLVKLIEHEWEDLAEALASGHLMMSGQVPAERTEDGRKEE